MVWVGRDLIDHPVQPPAIGRDPFHQPRVLRAPSNLALNTAREGAATASLGSLGQGLTTLTKENGLLSSLLFPATKYHRYLSASLMIIGGRAVLGRCSNQLGLL